MLILHDGAMTRNPDPQAANDDHAQARREERARGRLLSRADGRISEQPWRPASVPPSAVDLTQFALWQSMDAEPSELVDALALVPAVRAEVEGIETGLLFAARSAGLTWAQIASAMGFKSPQACQQHFTRLAERQDAP